MHKYGLTEKVLFASDYPHPDFKTTLKALKEVKLPLDFEKKILFENAVKLLRLSLWILLEYGVLVLASF